MGKAERDDSRLQNWWTKKRTLLVAVVALVILSGLTTMYLVMHKQPSAQVDKTRRSADQSTESGDYAKAFADLKKVENQATTKAQKLDLYSDLAAAAANAGQIGEALRYYDLKHQLDPATKAQDAYLLGTLYERSGDMPEAISAYRLALEYLRSQPAGPERGAEINALAAMIQELETAQ